MPGVGSWFRMRSPLQELEENKPATTTQKERIGITATGEYIVELSLLLVGRGNHYDMVVTASRGVITARRRSIL